MKKSRKRKNRHFPKKNVKKVKRAKKTKKVKKIRRVKSTKKAAKAKKIKKPKIKRKILKVIRKVKALPKKISLVKKNLKKKIEKIAVKKFVPVLPPEEEVHQTRIRIIGLGGGAGSIISEIAPDIKKVDFFAANTDSKSLQEVSKKVKKFQFGQSLTKGLGTGMNDVLGEAAAQNDKEKIRKLLEGQDLCIMVACLGGGTSSGAAPVFAKIARSLGNLTYGIFTLPFDFEGEKKMEMAVRALEKIKPNLNAYSVIPNERIFQVIDKNTSLKNALSVINKKLADNLEGLIEMIYLAGLINIDFADLKTVLKGRGRLTYLNSAELEALDKEEVVKKAISNPLYPYTLKGARGILYNIHGGKNIQLLEAASISRTISDSANKNAKIIFGINQNATPQAKIKITVLATGCGAKLSFEKPKQKSKGSEKPKNSPQKKKKMKSRNTKTEVKTQKKRPSKRVLSRKKIKRTISEKSPSAEKKPDYQPKKQPLSVPAVFQPERVNVKIRRNGLELKKAMELEEKQILEQEKAWETPAILRKNIEDNK